MKVSVKVMPIEDIVFDESLYPRHKYWWGTAYAYSEEMKAGARFPNITVGLLNGKHVLVDGKHRLEAYKINKETHVSVDVLSGLNEEELFLQAIKLNIAHGHTLSSYDKMKIIGKLEDMKFDMESISGIVQIPMGKLTNFIAKRITTTTFGKPQILKSAFKHLSNAKIPIENYEQSTISARSELSLVRQLIQVFSNEAFPKKDHEFVERVEELHMLLEEWLESKEIVKIRKEIKLKEKEE